MPHKTILRNLGLLLFGVFILGILGNTLSSAQEPDWDTYPITERCTVILVGKAASADGSVMVSQTADCGACDWTWHFIPSADYEPGAVRKIYHINQMRTWPPETGGKWEKVLEEGYTGLDIPQVPRTYAYMHGVFGHMNEYQLAFAESTIYGRRRMNNMTSTPKLDITMLTILAMERCKSARQAIKFMGELAEKHGFGGTDTGEMLAVADPEEAWIFEIFPVGPLWTPESEKSGAVWCAQRVPDDHVSFCPNESRIGEIDLKDEEQFLASPNAVSFAIEQKFYDPESGAPFNWKKAYSPTEGSTASTQAGRGRLWRLFDLVAPSRDFSDTTPNMDLPFSVKPDQKLALKDIIAINRDKYQGTSYDPAAGIKGGPFKNPYYYQGFRLDGEQYNGPRCISVNNAEYTSICVCRELLPNAIGGVVWVSFGAQDTSCYMPIYAGVTRIPESFSIGDHWEFNRRSARWAFDYVDFHTQVVYSYAIEDVKQAQKQWEDGAIEKAKAIERTAFELNKQDPQLVREFLTDFCLSNAQKVIQAWWNLGDQLLVKYNHFRLYDAEKRRLGRLQIPEEWNRAVKAQEGLTPLKKEE